MTMQRDRRRVFSTAIGSMLVGGVAYWVLSTLTKRVAQTA